MNIVNYYNIILLLLLIVLSYCIYAHLIASYSLHQKYLKLSYTPDNTVGKVIWHTYDHSSGFPPNSSSTIEIIHERGLFVIHRSSKVAAADSEITSAGRMDVDPIILRCPPFDSCMLLYQQCWYTVIDTFLIPYIFLLALHAALLSSKGSN